MLRGFLSNHVFANLTFAVILIIGVISYFLLPRQQDPEMNFNWIDITTVLPGGASEDVEKLVTDVLEEAIEGVDDIRFVISSSRDSVSNILVRFRELDPLVYNKRLADLRREIQNKERELPEEAEDPKLLEITSSNGFPTVSLVASGQARGENLRRETRRIVRQLERLSGVDAVQAMGLDEPELHIEFDVHKLAAAGVSPSTLSDLIAARFKDFSAGSARIGSESWVLRLHGVSSDPDALARWPIPDSLRRIGAAPQLGALTLGDVATVSRARSVSTATASINGQPGILLNLTKQANVNVLELTERVRDYVEEYNKLTDVTGVKLTLANDSTYFVRDVLSVMQTNALLGLVLVMIAAWIFLGGRIALLVGLGIPFTLAGAFASLFVMGETLNVMALLGVVIALGMLVDDAVVVVEAIHVRIERGAETLTACVDGLREVFAPVTASVLTTMAAFMPLMLLPGILGNFMKVVPMVVTLALAFSLLESYWMLPAHVAAMRLNLSRPNRIQRARSRIMQELRLFYIRRLVYVLRRPLRFLLICLLPLVGAIGLVASQQVRMEFFAFDAFPLFYVNVKMPPSASLAQSQAVAEEAARRVVANAEPGELVAAVPYAGLMMTETKPFFGDRFAQVLVSLDPKRMRERGMDAIVDGMRAAVEATPGPEELTFFILKGGPPVTKPVSVKVRGDEFDAILAAAADLKEMITTIPGSSDITDNYVPGRPQLTLVPDDDAIRRAGLSPAETLRVARLLADGETPVSFQHQGEKVEVRVRAAQRHWADAAALLAAPIALPGGGSVPLGTLARAEIQRGVDDIAHFNYRRAVTVEADLDKELTNETQAADLIRAAWSKMQSRHPGIDLDFSGILDDITESQNDIAVLFLFGIGVMYMILGAQFRSYFQPFLILITVPMAFSGVVFGLYVSGNPMSLYTLYGVVALSGIAVNSAIVLISAANDRRELGMSARHAIVYAARRRVIPILITSLTTIAGLFSLATGLGGESLLWGPVATAIVWGLAFSTLLTLFLTPLLYLTFMRWSEGRALRRAAKEATA
ncbi:efflux RND transporter permease subunit [Magnetofaba australis]|uniref:Putative acriflavin resistance protein n=1 Tax=Magnetofaba australis IT-1 TaxID=1434232 RepID=A0A1Y2K0J0_9PROT|nr:efflux RND transporter permease subunit [Magnetofaba australis]OSM01550.1 putative acriflavin resistance protein [Magnetofaba australis IT-1]